MLYLYEVQVSKTQRKKGLGRQLMQVRRGAVIWWEVRVTKIFCFSVQSLDTICGQVQLDKIMLTCLHSTYLTVDKEARLSSRF